MTFYETIGFYTLAVFFILTALKLLRFLWSSCLGSSLSFGYDFKHSDNAFTVITGATDGIGLEYARFFAKKGYRLFLLSRSEDKLTTTKESLLNEFTQCKEVQTMVVDFSKDDMYDEIQRKLEQLPRIDVLVNNVGLSYPHPDYFTKISTETLNALLNVNIKAMTRLTHICLSKMELQKKGLILNLSSFSAAYPTPLLAVYGSTKAYVDHLSRALQTEYANKNIVIQSILPAYVSTKMSKIRKASLMVPTPKTYIQSQMKTVGFENRTYGFWTHKAQGFVLDSIIGNLLGPDFIQKITFNSLKSVRDRAYKKHNLKSQ